jgi:hypothetical protein
MGEEDGVFFFFEVVNLEGERGDFPASLVVPFFTARVAFDVEQGFEQAFGFEIEFGGGGGCERETRHALNKGASRVASKADRVTKCYSSACAGENSWCFSGV